MKSTMVLTLQILLILFPVINVGSRDPDEDLRLFDDERNAEDIEENVAIPVELPKLCWGSPSSCIGLEAKMTITRNHQERAMMRAENHKDEKVMCYKNVRIHMTKECSRYQLFDFSDVYINDFCIGKYVQLGGSITMFQPVRRPFSIMTNITKVLSPGEKDPGMGNVHLIESNGCNIFGEFLCSRRRSPWCGCPLPMGRAPLFRARMYASADFIPKRLGTGKYIGKSVLSCSEGSACVEFSFERVEILRSLLDMND